MMKNARRRNRAGQALLEFALMVPLFFTMLFGIVDFGRVIWAGNAMANAAREAARFAVVHGGSGTTPCPVGPMGPESPPVSASPDCPYPAPSTQSIVDVAKNFAIGSGGVVTVTVCYGAGCVGNTSTGNNARGTPVTVVVTSNIMLFTGALLGMPDFQVQGTATMLVNH